MKVLAFSHPQKRNFFYFELQIQMISFSSKFDIYLQIFLRGMGKCNLQWLTEESRILKPADIRLPIQDLQ